MMLNAIGGLLLVLVVGWLVFELGRWREVSTIEEWIKKHWRYGKDGKRGKEELAALKTVIGGKSNDGN